MKAELFKRLFKAIFTEDIASLKKIAHIIIQDERTLGHNVLADSLENISITEKPRTFTTDSRSNSGNALTSLPASKRNNSQLVSFIPREHLKHHMILPENIESRLL